MKQAILLSAIGMAIAGTALAQTSLNRSQERDAIEVITEVGGTCERIVRNQDIGKIDGNLTLIAIACDGGEQERYVLQVDNRGNMTFMATCENLAVATNNETRCFA